MVGIARGEEAGKEGRTVGEEEADGMGKKKRAKKVMKRGKNSLRRS